jgi:hypothetical protein
VKTRSVVEQLASLSNLTTTFRRPAIENGVFVQTKFSQRVHGKWKQQQLFHFPLNKVRNLPFKTQYIFKDIFHLPTLKPQPCLEENRTHFFQIEGTFIMTGIEVAWIFFKCSDMYYLGSVAGPVIQVILGGRNLRMVWLTGDFGSGYSYDMSVRTGLSDHTKQTKFQSQRPSDVETPVPSIWVQKLSSIGTVSTWMGDRLMGLCSSYLQGKSWAAVGYMFCITSWGIDPMHCTTPTLLSPSQWPNDVEMKHLFPLSWVQKLYVTVGPKC